MFLPFNFTLNIKTKCCKKIETHIYVRQILCPVGRSGGPLRQMSPTMTWISMP